MITRSPSNRTSENNAATANATYVDFMLLQKNNNSVIEPNKMNRGSVNPATEFKINLGSNANIMTAITAKFLSTNLLHNK
jgi:hypothetical protein